MAYREVAKRLHTLGCEELPRRSSGSHRKWHNPITGHVTVLPDWGSKDLKWGTIRAAVRQLSLDWKNFNEL